jgi:hypothetical protein
LQNIKFPKNTSAKLYIASNTNDAKTAFCTQDALTDLSNPSFFVTVPAQSVVGIVFTKPKLALVESFLRVLGVSTSRDCLVGF